MIINRANLDILFTSFNAAYREGLIGRQATSQWSTVAMRVPSSVSEEKYGWIGKFPSLREWIGERVVHGMEQHDYAIRNKDFELTIAVNRNDIEDDKYGVYSPMFRGIGESVAAHPDELVWPLLKAGFGGTLGTAYDGQYFFDTDHPVVLENGTMGTVSNTGGGTGTAWFLADMRGMWRPLVYQERKTAGDIVRREQDDDDNVFSRNEYEYGIHMRDNVGFGWWQIIYGSKQALTAANYKAARTALMEMKGDYGRPLGLMPNSLIVPPSLDIDGREILTAERDAAGATNVYRGTAELVVVPWLA